MADLMIDIETLATGANSTILTIGAQGFDPFSEKYTGETFYQRLTIDSQADRAVDDDTVAWWGRQGEAAMEEALGDGDDRVEIKTALEELSKIAFKHNRFWANGITFDYVILEHAMQQSGVNIPWKFWQLMDTRTLYKIKKVGKLGNTHNALEDCCNQIDLLQKTLKALNITEF